MLNRKKKGLLLTFILVTVILIVMQPIQNSITRAAAGDGS